ncbi:signal peptidase complex-like protein DTM1 isoform X2 [Punica granatum]|uniref:Signal peptidase complex-like protein DTM1 isoform X2 n=1 Tax=Punica granatum TaxID=22663 RepID=A0A6P8DK68_PUNGR|nr:signal peptidase complex-like protein DTM1 isoform X2 [Punica granatum]
MADDTALRSALVWLAVVMAVVGLGTHSFKKMFVTYVLGMLGIVGILLPDWDYFDRDFSKWTTPVTGEERAAIASARRSGLSRASIRSEPARSVLDEHRYFYILKMAS